MKFLFITYCKSFSSTHLAVKPHDVSSWLQVWKGESVSLQVWKDSMLLLSLCSSSLLYWTVHDSWK